MTAHVLLVAAGLGQLGLAVASLAIPRVLGWRRDTAQLRPLTRQVFWTWGGYIWAGHVAFGLVSALAPQWLLDGSALGHAVAGYIALYWTVRILIQFVAFDRSDAPRGRRYQVAEALLVALFVGLAATYGWVALS